MLSRRHACTSALPTTDRRWAGCHADAVLRSTGAERRQGNRDEHAHVPVERAPAEQRDNRRKPDKCTHLRAFARRGSLFGVSQPRTHTDTHSERSIYLLFGIDRRSDPSAGLACLSIDTKAQGRPESASLPAEATVRFDERWLAISWLRQDPARAFAPAFLRLYRAPIRSASEMRARRLRGATQIRTFVRMPEPLSPRQQAVLDCIAGWTAQYGRPPTLREIAKALGLRQHSSAQAHVEALQRKGWLSRSSQHGSLRLLAPLPDGEQAIAGNDTVFLSLPLVGRVAAGAPILSEGHIEARYAIDPRLFRPRPHFLLRVQGESMTGIGIHDGDLIAVHRTPDAHDGQVVVARLDGEITVKRLRWRDGQWLLLAENPEFAAIAIPTDGSDFAIEGLYVGVIRRS